MHIQYGKKFIEIIAHNTLETKKDTWLWFSAESWWRHQVETFSVLLAICAGNSPVPSEFPAQRPVARSFDLFFDLRLNKRWSKQSWGWWFETLSCPLWRHCNGMQIYKFYRKLMAAILESVTWLHFLQWRQEYCSPAAKKTSSAQMNVPQHYNDVIISAMASPITSITTVYSRHRSKKTSKLRVTGLCEGNSLFISEFPAQRASNAENVSILWRHHENFPRLWH